MIENKDITDKYRVGIINIIQNFKKYKHFNIFEDYLMLPGLIILTNKHVWFESGCQTQLHSYLEYPVMV